MSDLRSPFRAAHLVMLSSPLLLLILVFTLTNASSSPNTSSTSTSSMRAITTTNPASAPTTTRTSTTVVSTLQRRISRVTTTTRVPYVAMPGETYVAPTSSIVRPLALAPNKNVASGVLAGTLSAAQPVADVPLEGPGSWMITTSSPTLGVLVCAGSTYAVATRFTLTLHQDCQLMITSTDHEVLPSWRLTPTR